MTTLIDMTGRGRKRIDLTGKHFGRWRVRAYVGRGTESERGDVTWQ
jgi:hypothetical protein